MPEDTTIIDNSKKDNPGGVADTKKTETPANQAFDVSKVGDEDFDKFFDDPRTFKHPRFASLREKAQKAAEYEAENKKAEEKRLADNKKFEELATIREKEREEWKGKYTSEKVNNKLIAEAVKLGAVDLDAVVKLVDRANIKVDDDNITGVEEAVKSLFDSKPYLKGSGGKTTLGSPSNPGGGGTTTKFKLSQLQNTAFWVENNKKGEIDYALSHGLVEDDMH